MHNNQVYLLGTIRDRPAYNYTVHVQLYYINTQDLYVLCSLAWAILIQPVLIQFLYDRLQDVKHRLKDVKHRLEDMKYHPEKALEDVLHHLQSVKHCLLYVFHHLQNVKLPVIRVMRLTRHRRRHTAVDHSALIPWIPWQPLSWT